MTRIKFQKLWKPNFQQCYRLATEQSPQLDVLTAIRPPEHSLKRHKSNNAPNYEQWPERRIQCVLIAQPSQHVSSCSMHKKVGRGLDFIFHLKIQHFVQTARAMMMKIEKISNPVSTNKSRKVSASIFHQ